ncbi:LysR family transcriptional regulator [Parachitinimonas caeni]|uniref:LysR substrate-binding domain-containing protein n=1 Tax=Parachitinimonas caeni TaxID=3031301 RepID=A0ABT7DQR9_9NEIS|nr:LysR family transcriptional regulator [Parachitinimonas caeni]MDK2122434.1 LysR substrate-binding domain-containing protein [Parachitinimonas caeni]
MSSPLLKLDQMAIFATVVECGSFTAAATQLGLPKSTVSQRLAELEQSIDLRLLQRSTRKLSLTEAGQVYLTHCQAMLEAARTADAAISQLRDAPAGALRITSPEASGLTLIPPMLAAFRKEFPQISVHSIVTDTHLDLIGDRIDLAFRTGRLHDSSFVSRKIGQVRRVLVAAPAYLAERGQPEEPADLAQHQCLLHSSLSQWMLTSEAGSTLFTPPASNLSSNSLCHLRQAAVAGAGIAMLPAFLCRQELTSGQLQVVLRHRPPVPTDYYAIYPSRSQLSAALTALLQFIEDYGLAGRLAD